ncbi:MAG: YgiT-type zinc finger protein [Acidobacteria bacterium]|nr:YgiT-type zinc finger protein [Acidobacteriota bacterium]
MSEQKYDYGRCHVCGEQMTEKLIKQEFWIKGNLVVIENVPAGVCPQCGEKVVKADIGQQISTLLAGANQLQPVRSINVPVFEFKAAA